MHQLRESTPSAGRPRGRQRGGTGRTSAGAVALCAALISTVLLAATPAAGSGTAAGPSALTTMPSGPSSLRTNPGGEATEDAVALVDGAGLGPSEGLADPADKTVLAMDQSLFTKAHYSFGGGNGFGDVNTTQQQVTRQTVDLDDAGTAVTTDSPDSVETTRASLEQKWPSEAGRLVDGTTESVLDLRKTEAGPDALFTLSAPNSAAENWAADASSSAPVLGTTYVIRPPDGGGGALGSPTSGAVGGTVSLQGVPAGASATPPASQQWTLVSRQYSDETFSQFVNRADGLCLAGRPDSSVTSVVCTSDASTLWTVLPEASGLVTMVNLSYGTLSVGGGQVALVPGDQLGTQVGLHAVSDPGGAIPTWSVLRTGATSKTQLTAPYDLAVADLDGVHGADGYFHDEAVVAYTDSNDSWALRVIDYNANDSRLLVTEPTGLSFGKNGRTIDGLYYPGDLIVEVGDFDGDGSHEIATGFQADDGAFTFYFWRYTASDGARSFTLIPSHQGVQPFKGVPYPTGNPYPTLVAGYTDSAVGDVDGDGRDDIAVAFAAGPNQWGTLDRLQATLGVWTLNTDLSTRSVEIVQPSMQYQLPMPELWVPPNANQFTQPEPLARTTSGLELEAGTFLFDPSAGFGRQRSQLAMGWVEYDLQNGTDGGVPYIRTVLAPKFQIFGTSLTSCNTVQKTCATSTTPTGDSQSARPIFPESAFTGSNRMEASGVAGALRRTNAPPLVFEAGRLGGQAAQDPPVDSVWATYNQVWSTNKADPSFGDSNFTYTLVKEIITPWVAGDQTQTKWAMTRFSAEGVGRGEAHRITPYDRAGESLVLGVPAVIDVEQLVTQDLLAAEPPKHVDWVASEAEFLNVSANSEFSLETSTGTSTKFSSETKAENGWTTGASTADKVSASFEVGIAKMKTSVEDKFSMVWSGTDASSTQSDTELSTTAASKTNGDDIVSMTSNDFQIYRYPVMGAAGQVDDEGKACTSACQRAYYEITVPRSAVVLTNGAGKTIDGYDPRWENLNALSYPASVSNKVPVPDLGPYSYTDSSGVVQEVDKELYNATTIVSSNSETVDLDFSQSAGSGTDRTTKRNWDNDLEVSVGASAEVHLPLLGGADFDTEVTSGWSVGQDSLNASSGTITTASSQTFALDVPTIDPSRSYGIGTAFYYSTGGRPKVTHSVDLTSASNGRSFWQSIYGQLPDPALNLPNRLSLAFNSGSKIYEDPYWITTPTRQLMRGFQVLHGASTGAVNNAGDPYAGSPTAGDEVVFQVQVSNYSLKALPAGTTADFYLVPTSDDALQVIGEAEHLGQVTVPAIGPQGTTTVASPAWTAEADDSGPVSSNQAYRVFVQLNSGGSVAEIHPLAGQACPEESLDPNDVPRVTELTDLMSEGENPDPVGCGSNNQGYGLVTVMPGGTLEAREEVPSPQVQLDGAGFVTDDPDHLELEEGDEVPSVPLRSTVTGLVRLSSDAHTNNGGLVAIYDGDPSTGNLLALQRTDGTDANDGGIVRFTWTPTEPGLHELHQVLLGTSHTGADDEQIVRVMVDEPTLTALQDELDAFQASRQVAGPVSYLLDRHLSAAGRLHDRGRTAAAVKELERFIGRLDAVPVRSRNSETVRSRHAAPDRSRISETADRRLRYQASALIDLWT